MKRSLVEIRSESSKLSKACADNVKAYWDQRFKNWVIHWRGKQIMEFLRGDRINPQKVKRHIHRIRNNKIGEEFEKADKIAEKNSKDLSNERDDILNQMGGDIFDYGIQGKKHFVRGV